MILCASIVSHKSLMEEATKCLFRTSLRSTHIQFILISATNWRHTNTSYMVSASVLRRLHTWSRASMGQDKLSALAMLHVHYMHPIDLLEVVDKFAKNILDECSWTICCSTDFIL